MTMSENAKALRAMYTRLILRKPDFSSGGYSDPTAEPISHLLEEATVVTSEHRAPGPRRHALVIDIDHPSWLIKSSTPNHYHLIVDVPGGIEDNDYWLLLTALYRAGVIEKGYARASERRGYSAVRLPWIKKPKPPVSVAPADLLDGW